MAEADPIRSLEESAERAAQSGDLAGAARLLREAAGLQQSSLGEQHPGLAHTLNNLGVVHERLDQLDAAEDCYRRAHAIALGAFPPDHPFVETSGRNLREFCVAHGRQATPLVTETPPAAVAPAPVTAAPEPRIVAAEPRVAAPGPPVVAPAPPIVAPEPRVTAPEPRVVAPEPVVAPVAAATAAAFNTRRLVFAACGLVVLAAALALVVRFWSESTAGADYVEPGTAPPATSSTPPAPGPAAPTPTPAAAAPAAPASAAPAPAPEIAPAAIAPTVVAARVCARLLTSGLKEWECDEVTESTNPGTLYFYTRVKTPVEITVQHRWYQGDQLWRSIDRRVGPNMSGGFRTFSLQTLTDAQAGDWRVELRGPNGALLGEGRFRVLTAAP